MANSIDSSNTLDHTAADAAPAPQIRELNSSRFITLTYINLTCAVALFAVLETLFFKLGDGDVVADYLCSLDAPNFKLYMLGFYGAYIAGIFIANFIQSCSQIRAVKYFSLALHVVLDAAFFVPILAIIQKYWGAAIIYQAIGLTAALFATLSASVFITRKDFSFMRAGLLFAGTALLGLILLHMLFGLNLGAWFTGATIGLLCMYLLYETSKLIYRENDEDDIDSAIELFATFSTLFIYILDCLVRSESND